MKISSERSVVAASVAGAICFSLLLGGTAANATEEPTDLGVTASTIPSSEADQPVGSEADGLGAPEEIAEVIAPEIFDQLGDVTPTDTAAAEFVEGDAVTTIPWSASENISLSTDSASIEVGLPFSSDAVLEDTNIDSAVAFDNGNDTTSLPIVHDDGSVQINTIIESADAPQRFDYPVSVPEGGSMTVNEDGTVFVLDSAGTFVAGVAPAWARDANGNNVNTWYEANGNVLTQVVEHSSESAFPIVADPWLGVRLFGKVTRDKYKGDWRYNAWITAWGALVLSGGGGVGGYIAGQHALRTAGWAEWKSAYPKITNKATLKQQYDCHVAAGFLGIAFTKDYNLERYRKNKSNWVPNVLGHRCNW